MFRNARLKKTSGLAEINSLCLCNEYLEKYVNPNISRSTESFIKAYSPLLMFYQPKGTTFNIIFKTELCCKVDKTYENLMCCTR